MAWWTDLLSWEYILQKIGEIAGREFIEAWGPLISTPAPWDVLSEEQNRRNFRTYVEHFDKVESIVLKLGINGFGLPDGPGRFSVEFINHQRALYVVPAVTFWVNEDFRLLLLNLGYDNCRTLPFPLNIPLSWVPIAAALVFPPQTVLGCVLWQMHRLRLLSQAIDAKHPEFFRDLER